MDLGSDKKGQAEGRSYDNQLVGRVFEITLLHWIARAVLFNVEQGETGCRSQIGSMLWRRFDSRRAFSYCLTTIFALGELRC
jgi:hypothetical protein